MRALRAVGAGALLNAEDDFYLPGPFDSDETEPPDELPPSEPPEPSPISALGPADLTRLRAMMSDHFDFIWRLLKRLGVQPADVDDCAQHVFVIAAGKMPVIARGSEQAFLFGIALNIAAEARRVHLRRRDTAAGLYPSAGDPGLQPDELTERSRARLLLDRVLLDMPLELRAIFILHELDELPLHRIAVLLKIPAGTAASRLQRSRKEFQRLAARFSNEASAPPQTPGKRS